LVAMRRKLVSFQTIVILLLLALALPGANPETATGKWSELGIIDVHAHTGSFRGYAIGADVLLQNVQRYGIKMALVSNIDGADMPETRNLNETEANKATADLVRKYPDQLRGLIWARPEDGSADTVAPFLQGSYQGLFVGMKFHPEFNHFQADDPRV